MRYLRGLSLFYRLLAVSTIAAAVMAVFASWVTTEHITARESSPHWEIAILLVAGGLAITLAIVFALTRIVLRPIEELQDSIVAFGAGDTSSRARQYPFTDSQVTRLIDAFNAMADSLVEKQAQLTQMSSRVIAGQEEELRRLSREIHDDAGQTLTTVLLGLKRLETQATDERVREALPAVRQHLSDALDSLRRLARSLRPSVLDDLGLAPAIRSSIKEFEELTPVTVESDVNALEARIPGNTEIVLYRVFQEAMTNVAKHANASTVRVSAGRSDGLVRMAIEDDGAGFDAAEPTFRARGVGLFSMAERLALVGGTLHVHSTPGRGTSIVAEVPLHDSD